MKNAQTALALTEDSALAQPASPMGMIQQALSQGTSPEVIRELVALQQSMERFNWEREERQGKIEFDNALNMCQQEIGRVAPNQHRENNIGWADYMQLDRTVRPVYLRAGFSIGFSEVESDDKGRLRMKATLSKGGISRDYFADISRNPANSKMNQLDADASAASRVKRYLLLSIFNIAVGIDKFEKKGIPESGMDPTALSQWVEKMRGCSDPGQLATIFREAYTAAEKLGDKAAMFDLIACNKAEKGRYK